MALDRTSGDRPDGERRGSPSVARRVHLFRSGDHQAVRIPKGMEFSGDRVMIRREKGRVILEASERQSLLAVLRTLSPIDEPFPEIEDRSPEPVDV